MQTVDTIDDVVVAAMVQYDELMEAGALVMRLLHRMDADATIITYVNSCLDAVVDPGPPLQRIEDVATCITLLEATERNYEQRLNQLLYTSLVWEHDHAA